MLYASHHTKDSEGGEGSSGDLSCLNVYEVGEDILRFIILDTCSLLIQ